MESYLFVNLKKISAALSCLIVLNLLLTLFPVSAESDGEPPVVHHIEVSPQEVEVGDKVKFQTGVTDDKSGVQRVTIYFKSPSQNRSESIRLAYNEITELWEGEYEIKNTDEEGAWKLEYIAASDYAGNLKLYYPRDFENGTSIEFKVINSEGDSEPPIVNHIEVSPQEVEVGDKVKSQAEVTDDKSGVRRVTIYFKSPSQNRSESIRLAYNEITELWEGEYEIKNTDEEGAWKFEYIAASDNAGNLKLYYPRDFENAENISFQFTTLDNSDENHVPEDTIQPLSEHYTSTNETWTNQTIDGDLYIGPQSILTVNGNVTVNGDVYVFGAMRNFGNLTIRGSLNARSINWGNSSTLYHGTVLMLGGTNQISSMRTSNQSWEVPVAFYNEDFIVRDGLLELTGATIPVIDLYIEGEKVELNKDGTFSIEVEDLSSNYVNYKTVDVFGYPVNRTIEVRHYGVPVWGEGKALSVDEIDESTISVSWDAATEEQGIAFYHLYQDGEKVASLDGSKREYTFQNLESSTVYQLMIVAEGVSGKHSTPIEASSTTGQSAEELARNEAINDAYIHIDSLPNYDDLTIEDKGAVNIARTKVEKAIQLGASEVDIENVHHLIALEEKLENLKQLHLERELALSEAIEAINALPSEDSLVIADQSVVEEARRKVDNALSLEVESSHITNISQLERLEMKLTELKAIEEAKVMAKAEAEQAITALPAKDLLREEDQSALEAARKLVEQAIEAGVMTEEITNLTKLTMLEEKLLELKAEKRVSLVRLHELPDKTDVQLSDIERNWAREDINLLTRKEIIFGYPNSTFRPNQQITRAEVIVIISRLLTPFPEETEEWMFKDPSPAWAEKSIIGGVSLGLIQGYPTNEFGANDQITRAELAVILNNVVQLVDAEQNREKQSVLVFNDQIPAWAQGAVSNMTELGLLSGYDDQTFRPYAQATRAEVASVINRLLQ